MSGNHVPADAQLLQSVGVRVRGRVGVKHSRPRRATDSTLAVVPPGYADERERSVRIIDHHTETRRDHDVNSIRVMMSTCFGEGPVFNGMWSLRQHAIAYRARFTALRGNCAPAGAPLLRSVVNARPRAAFNYGA